MPFSSSFDRILARWFAGLLAALLLALGSLTLINRLVYGPQGQVRAYFTAARAGDGSRALGILGAPLPQANPALLDGAALKAAFADLEDLTIETQDISPDGQLATVKASYSLDGQPASTNFELKKVGSYWGVFDQWQIQAQQLPSLEVRAPLEAITLNQTKLALPEGKTSFALLYPASYSLTYESALYSAPSQTLQVTDPGKQLEPLTLSLEPSEAARLSVQQQIKTYLDSCAAQSSLYPTGCPFDYDFSGRVEGHVTWQISRYPQAEVSLRGSSWSLSPAQGQAEISFRELDLYTGATRQVKQTLDFTLRGSLKAQDQALTFTPSP